MSPTILSSPAPLLTPRPVVAACPLNHGVATLDHLLAELMGAADAVAFDAALDLRWLLTNSADAEALLQHFFRLRNLIEERHYLACFRLRRWLEGQLVARVSADRHAPAICVPLQLAAVSLAGLRAQCIAAALGEDQSAAPWTRVRFTVASATPAPV